MLLPTFSRAQPFQVAEYANTLIKSNAFEIDCPGEVLSFDLKVWPAEKVWSWLREQTAARPVVAVPFKGKILALGTIDDIKDVFGDNIKGPVERSPVSPDELRYEDGAIVRLMREALVRSMAETAGVETDGHSELWLRETFKKVRKGDLLCHAHESVVVFLRRVGGTQYVVLKPSIRVLDQNGAEVPHEIAGPVKLGILGYQHNKPFNIAVNKWRELLFPKVGLRSLSFRAARDQASNSGSGVPLCSHRSVCRTAAGPHLFRRAFVLFSSTEGLS